MKQALVFFQLVIRLPQILFFLLIVKPVLLIVIGLHIRNRHNLPSEGPAIIVANHNSHLDTMVLMSLFPLLRLHEIKPVAAADYFLKNWFLKWVSTQLVGILPIERGIRDCKGNPLELPSQALEKGQVIILYPEGSRGQPEQLSDFKKGVAHLAKRSPDVPVIPVFLHGLGKALPKGEILLVPFTCDVAIGDSLFWQGDKERFMADLQDAMTALGEEVYQPGWD